MQPPTYQATAALILSHPSSELNRFGVSLVSAPSIDVNAYREAARSAPVLGASLEELSEQAVAPLHIEEFAEQLSVRTQENRLSSMLYLDFRSGDPAEAASSANAIARQLLAWDIDRATRNLLTIVGTLEGQIAALDAQLDELAANPDTGAQRESLGSLRAQQTVSLNSARLC